MYGCRDTGLVIFAQQAIVEWSALRPLVQNDLAEEMNNNAKLFMTVAMVKIDEVMSYLWRPSCRYVIMLFFLHFVSLCFSGSYLDEP